MLIKEDFKKPVGHLKIETISVETNEVIDTYEHHNMIMDKARTSIMNDTAGFANTNISKLVMGTKGHRDGDLLTPKTSADGFISSRTSLFSEETADYEYTIGFVPTTPNNYATVTEDDIGGGSTVLINIAGTTLTYIIEVGAAAANNAGQVPYTEGALYTGTDIFAMRCFPVRVKDSTTRFRITWNITF